MQTYTPFSRIETDVIQFVSLREPEFNFQEGFERLTSGGVRENIARTLAAYSAFQGEAFDFNSPRIIHVNEEIGQEPMEHGRMAA